MGAETKKRPVRRRALFFALFLVTAAVVVHGRGDLLRYVRGILPLGGTAHLLETAEDLPASVSPDGPRYRLEGLPDYATLVRFPDRGSRLTCVRMIGFERRLSVCTTGRLEQPEEIGDLLTPVRFEGRLVGLADCPFEERLRARGFQEGTVVLLGGRQALLPDLRTGFLLACCLLCLFFGWRTIQ